MCRNSGHKFDIVELSYVLVSEQYFGVVAACVTRTRDPIMNFNVLILNDF